MNIAHPFIFLQNIEALFVYSQLAYWNVQNSLYLRYVCAIALENCCCCYRSYTLACSSAVKIHMHTYINMHDTIVVAVVVLLTFTSYRSIASMPLASAVRWRSLVNNFQETSMYECVDVLVKVCTVYTKYILYMNQPKFVELFYANRHHQWNVCLCEWVPKYDNWDLFIEQ